MTSRTWWGAKAGAACVAALALAACGASEGGTNGPVDIETEDVSAYLTAPEAITVTEPLSEPAPEGLEVILVSNGFPQAVRIQAGLEEAADVLGWSIEEISYDPANPATVASAIESALSEGPDAVVLNGLVREQFAAQIPMAVEAGIPLVPIVGPLEAEEGVYPVIDTDVQHSQMGTLVTEVLLADAEESGTAAHVLQLTVPSVAVYLKPFDEAAKGVIEESCPDCTHELLELELADVLGGTYVEAVVSHLQRNPDINYVFADSDSLATGLPAALKQAGLTQVKIFGVSASKVQIDELRAGAPGAWAVQPYNEWGWIVADQIARIAIGDPTDLWAEDSLTQIVTADNADDVADEPNFPEGYQDQFKALWGV